MKVHLYINWRILTLEHEDEIRQLERKQFLFHFQMIFQDYTYFTEDYDHWGVFLYQKISPQLFQVS